MIVPRKQNPQVLISYSQDSVEHADRVLRMTNQLQRDGARVQIDQYEPYPEQGWPMWMEQQVARTNVVLMVCTERYFKRFNGTEVPGVGRGVAWESISIRQELTH
ncbi:MAG: toll/interleukin-1 receptor domain-containing protein [Planctomycetota bacterium]